LKQKLIILITILISFSGIAQVEENEKHGRIAPNFELEDINGGIFELNEIKGNGPIILSFFASICQLCREQTEAFSKIYNKYKDKGFMLIAISTDDQKTVAKVKPYIKSKGYSFPVLYDTNNDVARIYYAQAIPSSVIIDKNGRIVYTHLGYMKGDEIEVNNKIKQLLED
jgi:cytochrome c biogenesis protein CcmG/thiol:disulfide interchange protein DsbE